MKENNTPKKQAISEAKESILKKLGKRIKNFRKAMGYSQENLASDISKNNIIPDADDFSDKMISRYETGATEMGIIAFINICRGLRKTPNELLRNFLTGIKFEQSEILGLYEQLDDEHRIKAIDYLKYQLSDQNNGKISTLK